MAPSRVVLGQKEVSKGQVYKGADTQAYETYGQEDAGIDVDETEEEWIY